MPYRVPPPLRPGAVVAVVAPSSPFDRDELFRGLAWLRTRYTLRIATNIFARDGFLAGSDGRRAKELAAAIAAPDVAAILCARGGYGAMRILEDIPWASLAAHPKWIVGFSDVTAIHSEITASNICSIHGPNATGLGRSITADERASLIDALERPERASSWTSLEVVHRGADADGPILGGNLAIVCAMAAAGRFEVPRGAVLALEDVTERPYRIDRMLRALRLGGHLGRASALVFGGFEQCEPGPDGVTVHSVLEDATRGLGIPVLARAPFGHGRPNRAFILGQRARVANDTVRFG